MVYLETLNRDNKWRLSFQNIPKTLRSLLLKYSISNKTGIRGQVRSQKLSSKYVYPHNSNKFSRERYKTGKKPNNSCKAATVHSI